MTQHDAAVDLREQVVVTAVKWHDHAVSGAELVGAVYTYLAGPQPTALGNTLRAPQQRELINASTDKALCTCPIPDEQRAMAPGSSIPEPYSIAQWDPDCPVHPDVEVLTPDGYVIGRAESLIREWRADLLKGSTETE